MSLRQAAYALSPSLWAQECLGFNADTWQKDVLDGSSKKVLLCCSRQSGKSSVAAILALHQALYRSGSLTLMVSPSLRQSSELFRRFVSYLDLLPNIPARNEDTKLSLEMDNNSRVISLPGTEGTIRGFSSVDLLIIDEAARVADDLYFATKPMLAVSRGRMLALSTPWGKRGWYFKEFSEGRGWLKFTIPAIDCPRISPEFLEEERQSMPAAWFSSEYLCHFVEAEDSVFGYEDVMSAISADILPLEV
jgi:hypothetical protein